MIWRVFLMLTLLTGLGGYTYAQTCMHTNLSKKYNYQVALIRLTGKDSAEHVYSPQISILIIDKSTGKKVQRIFIAGEYLFERNFQDCKATRSYLTGKNASVEVIDFDYGDFVVADFNFDGREDIAVKTNNSADAGPFYTYYLQCTNGLFVRSGYLTNKVTFFPDEINRKSKKLVVYGHINATIGDVRTYTYSPLNKKWVLKEKYAKRRKVSLED